MQIVMKVTDTLGLKGSETSHTTLFPKNYLSPQQSVYLSQYNSSDVNTEYAELIDEGQAF